ncbi:DUF952 domain-containing protein [Longispora sp. K20-0274]|uniref:DUF952 domain-containing protein n=1 Tax=Longispora sp. K20-0274 TaxID=3088255 RepID=UPI00399A497C
MTVIYHLTEPATWAAAVAAGEYTMSTRDTTLAEEGYIHASLPDQVRGVAARYYADVPELLLLVIDTDELDAEVKLEQAGAGVFPHIYGPIRVAAVREVVEVAPDRSNLPE